MRKRSTSTNKLHMCIYVLSVIFYFWIASQIPYTHDDWDWGLDVGLRQFLYATVNIVSREHLPQLEKIQKVLPSRRDEAHLC